MALSEVLEQLPAGVAVLDPSLEITWCNDRLRILAQRDTLPLGQAFYELFGTPEILGPDLCPFHTAIGRGQPARSTLKIDEKRFYDVHVTPLLDHQADGSDAIQSLVTLVRDVSTQVQQQE